tara:strand:- start:381 stop:500 length:120 start_codon:yes stop_codon:yes gene_type:complete
MIDNRKTGSAIISVMGSLENTITLLGVSPADVTPTIFRF